MIRAVVEHQKGGANIRISFSAFFELWSEDSPEPILSPIPKYATCMSILL
jgi:hypothetical protein